MNIINNHLLKYIIIYNIIYRKKRFNSQNINFIKVDQYLM